MNDQHTPKFRIEPTGPDFTTLILEARDEVVDDPEISHGAARMFVKILDLSVRQSSKGIDQPPGVVTISQTKLHTWFAVSLRTVWNWKWELLEKGVVWMTNQPMPNAWPIDTYHITHLHPRKHSGDKTTAEGLWGNSARQSRPVTIGMGARQPGQVIIPGTGVRSNRLRVATGFQQSEESSILLENAAGHRSPLPASTETSCEPPPKPVATEARNRLRRATEAGCEPPPKQIAAGHRSQLRRATETDCEHKKAKGEGSSPIKGGSGATTHPDSAFETWCKSIAGTPQYPPHISKLERVAKNLAGEMEQARTPEGRAFAQRKLAFVRQLLNPKPPEELAAKAGPVRVVKPVAPAKAVALTADEILEGARYLLSQGKKSSLTPAQREALKAKGEL